MTEGDSLFSVGFFLRWGIELYEGINKQNDSTGALRKKLDRLSKEEDIESDQLYSLKAVLLGAADECTKGFPRHWLSGYVWDHVLNAYQELSLRLVILGVPQPYLLPLVWTEISVWFIRALPLWLKSTNRIPRLYTRDLLWFIPESEADGRNLRARYDLAFSNLKVLLGIDEDDDYKFTRFLHNVLSPTSQTRSDSGAGKDAIDERYKQVRSWTSGETLPDLATLTAIGQGILRHGKQFIKPHAGYGVREIVAEFLENALAARFGWGIARVFEQYDLPVSGGLKGLLWQALENAASVIDQYRGMPYIPSSFSFTEEYIDDYFAERLQRSIDECIPGEKAGDVTSIRMSILEYAVFLIEALASDKLELRQKVFELLLKVLDFAKYRIGPVYQLCLTAAYRYSVVSGDEKIRKRLHRAAVLNGIFNTPFDSTHGWKRSYSSKMEAEFSGNSIFIPLADAVDTDSMKHWVMGRRITHEELQWMRTWRKDRVNEMRVCRQFRRTRLMLASSCGDTDLVKKLLADGADVDLLSTPTEGKEGDNGSALLLAIQSYSSAFLWSHSSRVKIYREIIQTLVHSLPEHPKSLNAATRIKNLTVLGEAIRSSDPELVQVLLDAGCDPNALTGADEMTPLYEAISTLGMLKRRRTLGADGFLRWLYSGEVSVNPLRMNLPPSMAGITSSDFIHSMRYTLARDPRAYSLMIEVIESSIPSSPEAEHRMVRIIELLLTRGADPDSRQSNGFYPIDLALEIGSPVVVTVLKNAGATNTRTMTE